METLTFVSTVSSTPEAETSTSGETTAPKKVYAQPVLRKHGTFEATTHQTIPGV